ncbi:hypothetical protein HII31_00080 [Pseudocercospora fuligena]|uniref:C2H2-type domain-containing protein n=1 Tax=Pseudocercospora fuligena TaxID=685502 RepID=A0A8H6RWB6_9PEZI|nr:hypothetical protein HII31_00080 [Pseudocercospora fuligena]
MSLDPEPATSWSLWQICRAAMASPSFFSPLDANKFRFLDAAMAEENNPVGLAFKEVRRNHPIHYPCAIVSIGTGVPSQEESETGRSWKLPTLGTSEHLKNFREGVASVEEAHHRFERIIRDTSDRCRIMYFRFNPPNVDVELDDWKGPSGAGSRLRMDKAVEEYLNHPDIAERLQACAEALVSLRRQRAETERWEEYAFPGHIQYKCDLECSNGVCNTRAELRAHIRDAHGISGPSKSTLNDDGQNEQWICPTVDCNERTTQESEMVTHLQRVHAMQQPRFMTEVELENYLDHCRLTRSQLRARPSNHASWNDQSISGPNR